MILKTSSSGRAVKSKIHLMYALDVIRQNADLLGYQNALDILNDTEKYRILRQILQKKQHTHQNISLANIQYYSQEISRIKGGFSIANMQMSSIVENYNAELKRGNYLDFDDMICLCRKLLTENKSIRTGYQENLSIRFFEVRMVLY